MTHSTVTLSNGNTILHATCRSCGSTFTETIPTRDYDKWTRGTLIQSAFPYRDPNLRELLISGECGRCFDALFGDESIGEDDDEDCPAF